MTGIRQWILQLWKGGRTSLGLTQEDWHQLTSNYNFN